MKREDLLRLLTAAALSFCLVFGGVMCLVSGFGFDNYSFGAVLLFSLACAVLLPLAVHFRLGLAVLCAAALLSGYLWRRGSLEASAEALLYRITLRYHAGYGTGYLRWTDTPIGESTATMALCLTVFMLIFLLAHTLLRRRRMWLALPIALTPLAACLVLTDTVPKTGYVMLVLFAALLTLLTQGVRRRDPKQEVRLTAMLALPVALALGLLFLHNPQAAYDKQDGAVKLENYVQKLYNAFTTPEGITQLTQQIKNDIRLPITGDSTDSVNLGNVGPKNRQMQHVMSVTAARNGTLYLRGQSMDYYDGTSWDTTRTNETINSWPYQSELETVGDVTITTSAAHSVRYIPYYNASANWYESLENGSIANSGNLTTYIVRQAVLPSWYETVWTGDYRAYEESMNRFLQLPEETALWARALAAEILGTRVPLSAGEIEQRHVDAIVSYVKNSASYSLNTDRMPSGEQDFARWFLEESDTGYCIHFATATTVLLRAAGIPARYVTGYMLQGQQDVAVSVRLGDAHAWTEYRLPRKGWMVAEGTPGGGTSPVVTTPEETEPSQPAPTQPAQTTPDGETVQPTTDPAQPLPDWTWEGQPTLPQSTDPTQGTVQAPEQKPGPDLGWLWKLLLALLWLAAAAAAVVLQWRLRLKLRHDRQFRGSSKRQALARWREAVLLARLCRERPPGELHDLAQKAKFSRHSLTREELNTFQRYQTEAKARLRGKGALWQLFYRLVLALY